MHAQVLAENSMQCTVGENRESLIVTVIISTPHPGEMTIRTPDGRKIWLQADHIPHLYPATDNFKRLSEFTLDSQARGSWFNDWGEPEIVPILSGPGTYTIHIDNDLESRSNEKAEFACEFSLPGDET
jgi:hypothetical protein